MALNNTDTLITDLENAEVKSPAAYPNIKSIIK